MFEFTILNICIYTSILKASSILQLYLNSLQKYFESLKYYLQILSES